MAKASEYAPLTERVWTCLCRLDAAYGRYAKTVDMNAASLRVLHVIYSRRRGECTQSDIAGETMLSKQTVNNIVKALVKDQLVWIGESPRDGRMKTVKLTSKGLVRARTIFPPNEVARDGAFADLGNGDEAERLAVLLERYTAAYERAIAQGPEAAAHPAKHPAPDPTISLSEMLGYTK